MRELIVTGDDFGVSAGVNEAIEAGHREGLLSSASLMVGGAEAKDAAERARALPELSTGLHLVLCDGRAVSSPASIPDLVDGAGRFEPSPARAGVRYWTRWRRLRGQLELELRAQLEAYLALALPLDHVDGHHHLHMHPLLFDLLEGCLHEYGVPSLRLMDEDAAGRGVGSGAGAEIDVAVHRALARRHRRRLAQAGATRAPDRVYGLRASGRMDAHELARLIAAARGDRVEIYLHPDRATLQGRREEAALRDPAVRAALAACGRRLVGSSGRKRTLPA